MRKLWDTWGVLVVTVGSAVARAVHSGTAKQATVEDRVAQAAKVLDGYMAYWYGRVDTDRLDISSACWCVLGQMGGYATHLHWLRYYRSGAGFDTVRVVTCVGYYSNRELVSAWTTEIESRRVRAAALRRRHTLAA